MEPSQNNLHSRIPESTMSNLTQNKRAVAPPAVQPTLNDEFPTEIKPSSIGGEGAMSAATTIVTPRSMFVTAGSLSHMCLPTRLRALHRFELPEPKKTDMELFRMLVELYRKDLAPFSQRLISLRGIKYILIIDYGQEGHPAASPINTELRHDFICFKNRHSRSQDEKWWNIICRLADDQHHKYGLMFVEDWDGQKMTVVVVAALIVSLVTAILWIAVFRDVQAAMAVSTYILAAAALVLALFGVLSQLEA